jgi:hypothetical protein
MAAQMMATSMGEDASTTQVRIYFDWCLYIMFYFYRLVNKKTKRYSIIFFSM